MDDGTLLTWLKKDGTISSAYRLHTESFTKSENLLLIKVLKDNFNLDCSLHLKYKKSNKYLIYIKSNSMSNFKLLVFPFFHDSMLYKLN